MSTVKICERSAFSIVAIVLICLICITNSCKKKPEKIETTPDDRLSEECDSMAMAVRADGLVEYLPHSSRKKSNPNDRISTYNDNEVLKQILKSSHLCIREDLNRAYADSHLSIKISLNRNSLSNNQSKRFSFKLLLPRDLVRMPRAESSILSIRLDRNYTLAGDVNNLGDLKSVYIFFKPSISRDKKDSIELRATKIAVFATTQSDYYYDLDDASEYSFLNLTLLKKVRFEIPNKGVSTDRLLEILNGELNK